MFPNLWSSRDLHASLALLVFAIVYLAVGTRYPVETLDNPGPGVLPRAIGIFIALVATWQVVRVVWALRRRKGESVATHGRVESTVPESTARTQRPALMIVLLVAYLLAIPWAGFYVCTGVLILAASKLMRVPGWWHPLALGMGILLCCYVLFQVWLKVPFPRGYLF
jgi:hypothetical protein